MPHDDRGLRPSGVKLWVGYYRRALPRFLKVRYLVAEGAIGDVRLVRSQQFARLPAASVFAGGAVPWRVDPALSGGGFFFEAVCHTFDFLDFLFGPVEDLHGVAGNKADAWRSEDTVVASYRFASGVFGCGVWCYAADHDFEINEIVGSRGSLFFSTSEPLPIRLVCAGATSEIAVGDPPHVHQPLIQTIVDELNGVGHCPSTGESGARTAVVMDRILTGFTAKAAGKAQAEI